MIFSPRMFGQRPFSYPLYLFSVMTVLIGILIINGYFEIERTRTQLFNILETEGLLVVKSLGKNSGGLITALTQDHALSPGQGMMEGPEEALGIEDLIIERLIALALQLDQEYAGKNFDPQVRKDRLERLGVSQVFFLKADRDASWMVLPGPIKTRVPFFQGVLEGKTRLAVFRGEGALRQTITLSVAVARRVEKGIVVIVLSKEAYGSLGRQIIIQGYLEDFSGKGNIAYLRVEAPGGKVIAQTGEKFFEDAARNQWRKEVRSGDPGLFWIKGQGGEYLEIVRPFTPAGKELGRLRLGLSLKEVDPILNQGRRSVIVMSLVLFGLGLFSLFFIFHLQGRHLQKMREMEEQIRLKEELSAMGQLAAGVAHEIKNPLNAISLVVQRLQQEFHWPLVEEQKEYERFTQIVRNEITRVNKIIGQFLMMAKPPEIKLEEQALIDILNYVLEVMEEEFGQRGIQVTKEWEDKALRIRCDRFQMTQAFINIFNNALEAMPGGGKISLTAKRVRVTEQNRDFLEISVADTGQGIPADALKKIFAPYYTTKEKGVGLGLAITQKIIRAHGGTLEVQSLENYGTTVVVGLPT